MPDAHSTPATTEPVGPEAPLPAGRPFLVHVTIDTGAIPTDRRAAILGAERRRGRALHDTGRIERIWRVAETACSVGVWRAEDRSELEAVLHQLPIAPWARFEVTALALHPLETEATDHRRQAPVEPGATRPDERSPT